LRSIDGENVCVKISDTDSGTRRHFNGMTGNQLKQLRKDLGEAIGQPLTQTAKPPPMAGRKQEVLQLRE
jgi:hypothetical protein